MDAANTSKLLRKTWVQTQEIRDILGRVEQPKTQGMLIKHTSLVTTVHVSQVF